MTNSNTANKTDSRCGVGFLSVWRKGISIVRTGVNEDGVCTDQPYAGEGQFPIGMPPEKPENTFLSV